MDALYNMLVKLLAFKFLKLTPHPMDPSSFSRRGTRLSRAETLGFVVTQDLKPNKFIRFIIDDGTGCIRCILWLNNPSDVRLIADVVAKFASEIQLGVIARVRGRITGYRGMVQITVSDVLIERDPNSQVLHWLNCIRLARKCYDKHCKNTV